MSPNGEMSSQSQVWMRPIFKVVDIDGGDRTVDLRKLGTERLTTNIPWVALTLFERTQGRKREDFSQAAVRIVREATE